MISNDMQCPFCDERNFDAIGLKRHFNVPWLRCEEFKATPEFDVHEEDRGDE